MNEFQLDNSTIKTTTIQQINDINISSKKSKQNIKEQIKKFQLFICLKGCFNHLIKNYNYCLSKCSLITQFLLFLVPFSFLLYFAIYFLHYFGFERIFKFDYYYAVEKEYLNYLISDLDDIHFEISSKEIESQFEDIDNLYFFEIYFQELISMGLLDEDPPQKIFPNISQNSQTLYQSYDEFQKDNNINCIYTLSEEEVKKYIDDREDNLSEIAKIYYYFLPIITYEAITKKTYINETYLISYEFDYETKEIMGDSLYFSYPSKANEFIITSNFFPTNSIMSPQVSKNKIEHKEKYNNSFYKENWFIQQDYNYRNIANDDNSCEIIFSNLNYDYYGILNKSNIVSLQSYFHSNINNKAYIINIIYYISQKEYIEESLEFSSFLLFNDSLDPLETEKYSDNDTFLVSKLNIAELTLSNTITNYFHYGMYDKNYNFFKHGISFDSINLEELGEPLKLYKSIENFKIDLRYFSSLYLYSSLFRKLNYNLTKEESKQLTEINFDNENNITQNICKEINFSSYLNYLENENIDCFNENNMLYYSERGTQEDIFHFNYNAMPYCICLPLYCLKHLEKGIDIFEYAEEIKLPDKCQNIFKNYLNGVEEKHKEHSSKSNPILKFDFGFNNLDVLSGDLKESIEDEFYIYKSLKFSQLPKIIFMIITLVSNSPIKDLLSTLISKIDEMKSYYIIIELSGMFIAFITGIILVIVKILKITKVIADYEKIHQNFLYKIESSTTKEKNQDKNNNENTNFNSMNKLEKVNYSDNLDLKRNGKNFLNNNNIYNINFYSNDNSLLNELSILFRNYYKFSKEELNKLNHENKHSKNQQQYSDFEENELFKFLKIISFYIPKFKLNVSMDYNFYINSKLNKNYLKSITKGQHHNHQLILLTQSVIFELLSTENIENYGLITNFNFKYITNINVNLKKENSSIKNSMFSFVEKDTSKYNEDDKSYNNNEILIEGQNKKDNIKIIWKEKNKILEEFENNFENDDYLKKDKIHSAFDSYLINAYYKYTKKILCFKSSSSESLEEKDE